ncbi:MAG: DUF3096 domain-containing protein [Verrucomicrobia bacterium]|nr:DUF3096 domain-containing protein [Verrucomicrobiota bacterium]
MFSFLATILPLLLARSSHNFGLSWRFGLELQPVIALLAGVLVLVRPKSLNYIVAAYLIVIGVVGILHLAF